MNRSSEEINSAPMTVQKPKYVIITPVRDEEEYLPKTIESVVGQTVRPMEWIIVNDGSKDSTGKIVDEAAKQHNWIKGVHC